MTERDELVEATRTTRRTFLKGIGAGAGIMALRPGMAFAGHTGGGGSPAEQFFGRIFDDLPPFAPNSSALQGALMELGALGGIMDAKDALERGPIDLIIDPELSENNPDNPTMTAGMTFVGQFLDRDMTFDGSSELGEPTPPGSVPNLRTPTLDLDSVYGGGPVATPQLYESDGVRLRIEHGGLFEDLPRDSNNTAIIADPRNDENLMIAGFHAAVILAHNRAVEMVQSEGVTNPAQVFAEARRRVTWHYHWIILHEVVPQFVGHGLVQHILGFGRRVYTPSQPFMPVEFQGAVYRFGHTLVRPSYRANLAGDNGEPFFGMIFDPTNNPGNDPDDMRGGARAPRRFIDWETFFRFNDQDVRPNKLMDTTISTPLFQLPIFTIPGFEGGQPIALPQRNLLRHITWELPSGQAIARAIGEPLLSDADLEDLSDFKGPGFDLQRDTPLWFYALREGHVMNAGWHLGRVGGRLVGETIIGLLQLDPNSYLTQQPDWRPTFPSLHPGAFTIRDFLTFAGVDPASRASS